MTQTAMQELIKWMEDSSTVIPFDQEDCYNKAIELVEKEKEQTIDAYADGYNNGYCFLYGDARITGEEYYNITYNTPA